MRVPPTPYDLNPPHMGGVPGTSVGSERPNQNVAFHNLTAKRLAERFPPHGFGQSTAYNAFVDSDGAEQKATSFSATRPFAPVRGSLPMGSVRGDPLPDNEIGPFFRSWMFLPPARSADKKNPRWTQRSTDGPH